MISADERSLPRAASSFGNVEAIPVRGIDVVPARRKRILFVDHTAKMGGGEVALLNLVRHLERVKIEPQVLLFSEGALAEKMRETVVTHVLPLGMELAERRKESLTAKSLFNLPAIALLVVFLIRLWRFIRSHQFDLIYTNSLKSDIIAGIAGRLALKPVIWHVRDRIEADYLPRSVVWMFRVLARVIPNYVVANSIATMKTIGVSPERSSAVPSGADLRGTSVVLERTLATVEQDVVDSSRCRLGLIGRISPWKGQHIFLRAAALVHQDYPKAFFSIIGAALFNEHAYETEIRALVVELGLASVVRFTGFSSNVMELISELEIVVHASTTGEPFGQVIIEGMAAAKPVIATNGGGVPEIVLDGETGILVAMGSVLEMASAMRWMIDHPVEARGMGEKGKLRVEQEFTIQKSVRRVEAICLKVLAGC